MRPRSERDLQQLGPFVGGANNLREETALPSDFFREGVNVDVSDSGRISRREGYTQAISAPDACGLVGVGPRAFYAQAGGLYGFEFVDGAVTAPLLLADGLQYEFLAGHALVGPDIYYSDGVVAYRIAPDNSVSSWGVEAPPTPVVALAAGPNPPGQYQVAVAYMLSTGEEGALSQILTFQVDEPSSFSFALPASSMRKAVYLTKPNGTELLLASLVAPSATTYVFGGGRLGRPSPTAFMDPMPAGSFAAYWNGRLLVAVENRVHWSQPMHYSLTDLGYNYLVLVEQVTMVAATDTSNGFYVGQPSRTYFVRGANPNDASLVEAYPAGVVPGTLAYIPGSRLPMDPPVTQLVPMWLATNGVFCAGLPDGSIVPLTEARYAARAGDQGAAMFVQKDGASRYVATVRNPTDNVFAVTDSLTAEVVPPSTP